MLLKILFVGTGGFVGAILRFLTDRAISGKFGHIEFPLGIFICNVVGCFLIGFLSGMLSSSNIAEHHKALVFTGLLGSFTTFSTFSKDSLELMMNNHIISASLNIFLSLGVGILFVFLGQLLARQIKI